MGGTVQHYSNGGQVPPLQPGGSDSYDAYLAALQSQSAPQAPTGGQSATQTVMGLRKKMTGYANGTPNVDGGSEGPGVAAPAQIPPELVQALMKGHGGGMPPGNPKAAPKGKPPAKAAKKPSSPKGKSPSQPAA
jgi:hypothetical protein